LISAAFERWFGSPGGGDTFEAKVQRSQLHNGPGKLLGYPEGPPGINGFYGRRQNIGSPVDFSPDDLRSTTVRFIAKPTQYSGKAKTKYLLTIGYSLTEYWCRIDGVLVPVIEENSAWEASQSREVVRRNLK
jgi:hypothetical protein